MRLSAMDRRQNPEMGTGEPALPLGSSTAGGRVRWYFVHCPEGRERSFAKDLRRIVSRNVLRDAFAPCSELETLVEGRMRLSVAAVFPGYFVAVTDDPRGLQQEILAHTYPVYVAGKVGDSYVPVAEEAQAFLESVLDSHHVIRFSDVTVDERGVHVTSGPLKDVNGHIASIEQDGRRAVVRVGARDDGSAFGIPVPVRVSDTETQPEQTPNKRHDHSLPLSRRTPKGRLRWYLVECPEGREEFLCRAVHETIPHSILHDACVPKTEVIKKERGEWVRSVRQLFAGRFAVATTDAAALSVRLQRLGLPVRLAGGDGRTFAPVDDDAWQFLSSCMDDTSTIRGSWGEIVDDELHVQRGPLAGRESRVIGYKRRKRLCFVDVGEDAAGRHSLVMPLEILARR